MKERKRTVFGDFQTPYSLAREVCDLLAGLRISPKSILEPTCGYGSFLRAATDAFPSCKQVLGYDINADYVKSASTIEGPLIRQQDFFRHDWPATLKCLRQPILVIGNPPWVTNSAVGKLRDTNLPTKSNFQRLRGFEAITGKSNFDISEWMLIHLMECLSGKHAVVAMLCKTAVARKVLRHAWTSDFEISESRVYPIDANRHFRASVDACLLVSVFRPKASSSDCRIYPKLGPSLTYDTNFALRQGRLVADLTLYNTYGYLAGESPIRWRSGIKHDCSRIMELHRKSGNKFQNAMRETVDLELDHLYPMLKSSDLLKPSAVPSRYMLVTQRFVGETTSRIEREAPKTWNYLQCHGYRFDQRRSSIYRNRPRFSMFGVGPYSFTPWKVAISGFAKHLAFHCIGPHESKPVVLDDTCYFLPCDSEDDANTIAGLLNSDTAHGFLNSFIFWDAKRPITSQLLSTLDLNALATEAGIEHLRSWSDSTDGLVPRLF